MTSVDSERPSQALTAWTQVDLGSYAPHYVALLEQLNAAEKVLAHWLHGSRAIATHRPSSDLDICVIAPTSDARQNIFVRCMKVLSYDESFPDYFTQNQEPLWTCPAGEVGLRVLLSSDVERHLGEFLADIKGLEARQAFVQHVLVEAVPVKDPNRILASYQEKAKQVPDAMWGQLASKYTALISQKIRWWGIRVAWKSEFERLSDTAVIVQELARLHYALNHRLYMPGMKEYSQDLRYLKPDISDCMRSLCDLPCNLSDNELRERFRQAYSALITEKEVDPVDQ